MRVLSRYQLSYCDVTISNRLIAHSEFSNLAVLAYRDLSIVAYFIKIRGFPNVGVEGGCKILHGSTLTNISAKFHDDTFCSVVVLFMDGQPLKGVATKNNRPIAYTSTDYAIHNGGLVKIQSRL